MAMPANSACGARCRAPINRSSLCRVAIAGASSDPRKQELQLLPRIRQGVEEEQPADVDEEQREAPSRRATAGEPPGQRLAAAPQHRAIVSGDSQTHAVIQAPAD